MKYAPTAALLLAAIPLLATQALAGDAAVGEKEFNKCKACHSIVATDGTVVQKGGKTGPNLFGVIGRTVGALDGFTYGEGIEEARAKGLVWDEASLATYVTDPTAWLKEVTGDDKAKSKMSFKLRAKQEDVAAYLATQK
jgi:cytochrome c